MKYKNGEYVECIRDFITHKQFLTKGKLYKVLEYLASSEGGIDKHDGIIRIEANDVCQYDSFTDNYFKKIVHD
jgi:hypothetical protein